MTRSGSPYSTPRDANRVPLLVAASTADGITPVVLEADPATHQLQVSSSGGSSGTQYTDGGVPPAHPVGNTIEWSDGSNWQTVSNAQPLPTTFVDATATGNITSNQSVTVSTVGGRGGIGIYISGTWTGTLAVEASADGTNFATTTMLSVTTGTPITSTAANGTFQANTAGLASFRIRGNTVGSGTAVIYLRAADDVPSVMLDNPIPTGSNTIGNVGLNGGSNNVGSFNMRDGAGNALTSNSATTVAKTALDQNLISILGTAPTTAGFLDIKGADGNVFVRQATASNLNATVVQGTATNLKTQAENYQGGTAVGSGNPLQVTLANTGANATAVKVDGSAVTQPVNGTVTANAGTGTFNIQSNASVNLAQLAGNTISSGVGTSGTGTLRTVTANDTGRTLLSAGGSASSSGNNTLVAAGTNRLKVFAFTLSTTSTSSTTCIFQSGASGTELWRVVLQAPTSVSTGANLVVQPPAWLFATASATLLNLNLSGANIVHWSVSYWDEA